MFLILFKLLAMFKSKYQLYQERQMFRCELSYSSVKCHKMYETIGFKVL
jgi:hypothetical protein